MVGRGSRVIEGVKNTFNVMDFGNNILNHGFWHEPVKWDIGIKKNRTTKKQEAVLKNCESCEAFIPASSTICKECGYEYVKLKKEQEIARLQLLDTRDAWKMFENSTVEKRIEMSKAKIINPMRVLHDLRKLKDVKKFLKGMGYDHRWVAMNQHRYWWRDQIYVK